MKSKSFKLGELFSGPGGLAFGALSSHSDDNELSVSHAWSSDYDKDSCNTYIKNICPDNPESVYCKDVRELDLDNLPCIDAFAYGFPCNSFSNVGQHEGLANERFGQLYFFGVKVLKKYKPKWFIAENVSGIRSSGSNDFHIILKDMEDAGYKLTVHLYKAEDYGVPQKRHRVIIVGIRNDLNLEFKVPDPITYSDVDISARNALANISDSVPNNEHRKLSSTITERLSYIKPGENIWQAESRMPEHLKIKTKTKISGLYAKKRHEMLYNQLR